MPRDLIVIKVGIGGGGVNAVNQMVEVGVQGVEFIAVNADAQALLLSMADVKLDIGRELTGGRGAAAEYPSDLRRHPRPLRLTLLAVLCHCRRTEITDSLVELLIGVVHKVHTRAERRVEGELLTELRRVRGKEGLLSASPKPPWTIPTRRCAPRCTRWSQRGRCGSWSARPGPARSPSGRGCVRCCARRIRRTTGGCCRRC